MELKWEDYIKVVGDAFGAVALEKLKGLAIESAAPGFAYLSKHCQLIDKYTKQKAEGKISLEEYNGLLMDLTDILKLETLKGNLRARQMVKEIIDACLSIVTNNLGKLIVF